MKMCQSVQHYHGVVDFVLGECQIDDADLMYSWPLVEPDFVTFNIRNNDGSIESPWDTAIMVAENADEDGYSAETPRSGYGIQLIFGDTQSNFERITSDK